MEEEVTVSEEQRRMVRSELAREAVNKRWARLSADERRLAVKPANEARRLQGRLGGRPHKKRPRIKHGMLSIAQLRETRAKYRELRALVKALRN